MYDETVKRLKNCATQAAPCLTCDMTDDGSCIETLMKQAADAIEELSLTADSYKRSMEAWADEAANAQPKWENVTERQPEDFKKVLVFWVDGSELMMDTAVWRESEKRFAIGHWVGVGDKITHWMPLPEPPKEET